MFTETLEPRQMRQLLWAHAARQAVEGVPSNTEYEIVAAGHGWGLRHRVDRHRALLIHPSATDSTTGDLSLTILGYGTHIIPRGGRSFAAYLNEVADIVETTAHSYLLH